MSKGEKDYFLRIEEHLGTVDAATGNETWVEDAYGDGAWTQRDAPVSSQFLGLAAKSRRLVIFFFCIFGLFIGLWAKAGYLIAQTGSFKARSDSNRIRTVTTAAPRGIIFDSNGVQLTDNMADLKLAIVPADLPEEEGARREAISAIARLAGVEPGAIESALKGFGERGYQAVTIADDITRSQAVDLTIAKSDYPAIRIINGSHRYYGLANTLGSLSHLLGYMGRITAEDLKKSDLRAYQPTDSIGRTGLEYSYEKRLVGKPSVRKVEVDAVGNEVGIVGQEDAVPGENIRLTIDSELTAVAEKSLLDTMSKLNLRKGAVLVEDVKTGGLLALISLPSFSNNRFATGISQSEYRQLADDPDHPLFNRAISGAYPPGSTAKIVVAAGALAEGIVTPKTTVDSVGGIRYGQWWFPDWKAGGHGVTDVKRAIAWSVNTFFYMVGGGTEAFKGLGISGLGKYYSLFGIGQKLGIDIPNEALGFVPTAEWKKEAKKEQWYIGDTYHAAIGQGDLLATPLQMVSWTAAIANGGTLWRPHLVKEFIDAEGKVLEKLDVSAVRTQVVDDRHLAVVRQGMRQTVTDGSAKILQYVGMDVAGKTGTAQVSGKDNHAWFTGYGPYEDPQIAVTVLVENGKEGASVAVPIARDIFAWYAANKLDHE
jgi:penicillin-binding protein 2